MKKRIIIIAICLIVIAGGVLIGLYIIGDNIMDEIIDTNIPTISDQSTEAINETEEQTAQMSQTTTSMATDITNTDKTSTATGENNEKTKQPTISVEKMNDIKDKVTAQDKVSAAVMVMSKLSSDEVNELKDMLSGGLTVEEKAKAKSIAYAKFSSEEIKKIKEIYSKYMSK